MIKLYIGFVGTKSWYTNELCHRLDGPAIIHQDGAQFWFKNGRLHRDSGPAMIHSPNHQEWYYNGMLHRTDGPAVIIPDVKEQYWLHDRQLTEYEAMFIIENNKVWFT